MEKEKLKTVVEITQNLLNENKIKLKKLYNSLTGGNKEEVMRDIYDTKMIINNLESSLLKPYFGRIDFQSNNNNEIVYIGKHGISLNTNIIVTDWRAPISSLYYDSQIGECSYNSPSGIIKGNMSLKRQYEIVDSKLISYYDVDLISNDELLQKYLNKNNSSRIKNIVDTIQKEQNDVIRKSINNNLIVQGVAGSGKTTVALHRLAYLVYNYKDTIKQNEYMIIGPNKVFLKYIENVLPDLEVGYAEQYTYIDYVKKYVGEKININNQDKNLNLENVNLINNNINKFKGLMKYKDMIDKFLKDYIYNIFKDDLTINNFKIIDKSIIENYFFEILNNNFSNLSNKIDLTIDKIIKLIERKFDKIILNYNNYTIDIFEKTNKNKELLKKQFVKDKKELTINYKSLVRKYFSRLNLNATYIYKLFMNNILDYNIYDYEYINELKKFSLKSNRYDFEDLAALIYIKSLIKSNYDFKSKKQIIIDEAQDFSEFNFYTFRLCMPYATFSIFGDIAQSIYDYRSIDNWDEVNNVMFNNNGQCLSFKKSYRTTKQIMSVADYVANYINLEKSELNVREGNKVKITKVNSNLVEDYIKDKINYYKDKGYKTIGIISKTDKLSLEINKKLSKIGIDIPNISIDDNLNDEEFNICTISNALAKGLEFDAVIIYNAEDDVYNSETILDMKLLYIAITRALHELEIIYNNKVTKVLYEVINNTNLL